MLRPPATLARLRQREETPPAVVARTAAVKAFLKRPAAAPRPVLRLPAVLPAITQATAAGSGAGGANDTGGKATGGSASGGSASSGGASGGSASGAGTRSSGASGGGGTGGKATGGATTGGATTGGATTGGIAAGGTVLGGTTAAGGTKTTGGATATGGTTSTGALAATPPMGWNSWNKFGGSITDTLVRGIADAMVSTGMQAAGYQYINIDDMWQASSRDSSGKHCAQRHQVPERNESPC